MQMHRNIFLYAQQKQLQSPLETLLGAVPISAGHHASDLDTGTPANPGRAARVRHRPCGSEQCTVTVTAHREPWFQFFHRLGKQWKVVAPSHPAPGLLDSHHSSCIIVQMLPVLPLQARVLRSIMIGCKLCATVYCTLCTLTERPCTSPWLAPRSSSYWCLNDCVDGQFAALVIMPHASS
jgi:hypothetical protein